MAASEDGLAHPYVDIAHRAALLYSFATLLLAAFVELSGFPTAVNLIAAFVPIFFFVGRDRRLLDPRRPPRHRQPVPRPGPRHPRLHVGADRRRDRRRAVLIAGFFDGQIF